MKIYDQHVHTLLSYDSRESLESYIDIILKEGIDTIVTTEHMDLGCASMHDMDIIPDFVMQDEIIKSLSKKYNIDILKGIEVGYKKSRKEDSDKIIKEQSFDVVLMSVHEDEGDASSEQNLLYNLPAEKAYAKYIELYTDMLIECDDFDIVAHIDYLLRYIGRVDISNHEHALKKLMKLIIAKKKALEFNTRFIYKYNNTSYLEYLFTLYYELGGRRVSLGSDCHSKDTYKAGFDTAIALLKKIGFTELCLYKKRKEFRVGI